MKLPQQRMPDICVDAKLHRGAQDNTPTNTSTKNGVGLEVSETPPQVLEEFWGSSSPGSLEDSELRLLPTALEDTC